MRFYLAAYPGYWLPPNKTGFIFNFFPNKPLISGVTFNFTDLEIKLSKSQDIISLIKISSLSIIFNKKNSDYINLDVSKIIFKKFSKI